MPSNELGPALVHAAPCAMLALDADGVVRLANAATAALVGLPLGSVVGRHLDALLPRREGSLFAALGSSTTRDAEIEVELESASGAARWIGVRARAEADATFVYAVDRTGRHHRHEARTEVVRAARAGIVTTDEAQRVLSMNPSAERIFGVREEGVVGRSLSALVPPRLHGVHEDHRRTLGEQSVPKPHRLVSGQHADGREIPLEVSVFRSDVAGHTRFTAIARDVTEREAMLTRLREAEGRYRGVFRSVPVGLVLLRARDFVVQDVNDAYVRISGIPRERILGANYASFVADPEATRRIAERFQQQGHITQEPYRYRRPDGSIARASISSRAYRRGGEPHLLIMVEDVTAREAAEERLRDDAQRFADLAESIRECFWTADPKTGATLYASPAFAEVWGVSPEEVVRGGHAFWERSIHPDDHARVMGDLEARQGGGDYDVEYASAGPTGRLAGCTRASGRSTGPRARPRA